MKNKTPWHQSNAGLFSESRAYFNEKYGTQTEKAKLGRINRLNTDKYAKNIISYVRHAEERYSLDY